ncbi:hypothetical protein COCOBI_12-0720 [Coccomyxa sp. Obi]|nr:hypothetical protein COCOBI_12-0720 [Coccomyxa sp. Obi]
MRLSCSIWGQTVGEFLTKARSKPLGTLARRLSKTTTAYHTSYQPAIVDSWVDFDDDFIPQFLEKVSYEDLRKEIPT